ncbi:MAG: ABC transporter ATP-binding protein [Gemmatimonadota bacterium]|nr:ABC transporter ATP-binding protein [Gemmatimonadota bacterium]
MSTLLDIRNLKTYFYRRDGVVRAVDGISYEVGERESVGVVGESGSGKSVSMLSVVRLIGGRGKIEAGEVVFEGRNLLQLDESALQEIRGNDIGFIFQNPQTSLNPTMRSGPQIAEPVLWHGRADRKRSFERAVSLLEEVGIPAPASRYRNYPFELSGGMKQRVMIAMALSCEPKLMIADEPTTALDVTTQAQIMDLLNRMKASYGMSTVLITHDFGLAVEFSDRIVVMYAGTVAEIAPVRDFLNSPRHPYSIGLLENAKMVRGRLDTIPGQPPDMTRPPSGCRFHPRCPRATDRCREEHPGVTRISDDHAVYCWHYDA